MHRHFPSSFLTEAPELGRHSFEELSARFRALTDEGVVPQGPLEPLANNGPETPGETQRFHLWVVAAPALNYRDLRVQLGESNLALRLHFIEHPSHALQVLGGLRRHPIHAIAVRGRLPNLQNRELVASIRARRQLRPIPLFICDTAYCPQHSRDLYAAGASGYLCGRAATRQLGAALMRRYQRPVSSSARFA